MSYRTTRALALLIVSFGSLAAIYTGVTFAAGPAAGPAPTTHSPLVAMPTGTPMPVCGMGWNMVLNNGDDGNLYSISAIAPNDVWGVGSYPNSIGRGAIATHWDGLNWTNAATPDFGWNTELEGIATISTHDVWAVGYASNQPFILHWDGVEWGIRPAPHELQGGALLGVSAAATDDVWAVGWHYADNTTQPLIMHWDGANWYAVPSPSAEAGEITSISTRASDDVWAVGFYGTPKQTLVEHWNGTQWSVVPSPNVAGFGNNELHGVAAIADNDAWAVGYYSNPATGAMQAITLHWDGSQWNSVPNPAMGINTPGFLYGISALSSDDIWSVGGISGDSGPNLTMHWDGTTWNTVESSRAMGGDQYLTGVSALSTGDIWAAGHYSGGSPCGELAMRYFDHCAVAGALVSHVTWQGPPAQPDMLQQLPITLTVGSSASHVEYSSQTTTANGFFTMSVGTLPPGTYNWRANGPKYLANAGYVTLTAGQPASLVVGVMKVGDTNDDNRINIQDFDILKIKFAKRIGDPGYDACADFDRNDWVNVADFNLLKANFGVGGAPPIEGSNP